MIAQLVGADGEVDRERDGPAMLTPEDGEIERAIASVAGVASASLRRDPATGRTRLRLKLKPGEDAEQATWAVAATLRERFGIALDPDAIRPVLTVDEVAPAAQDESTVPPGQDTAAVGGEEDTAAVGGEEDTAAVGGEEDTSAAAEEAPGPFAPGPEVAPPTAPPAPPPPPVTTVPLVPPTATRPEEATDTPGADDRAGQQARARITRLDVQRGDHRVEVSVGLRHGEISAEGVARAALTARSVQRAIAEATASALQQLIAAPLLIAIDRVDVEPAADPARALVTLTLMADRGEEELIGVSLVRGQPDHAVVRATLDACNRRLARFLDPSPTGPLVPAS